ncbi:MAG: monovalent cation:proton antiporter-2 (CPA2) family protein [Pseudomonadota bacterium]
MHEHQQLAEILVFLVAAVVIVTLVPRLGLGSIVGYLAAGVVLGPHVLGMAAPKELTFLAELGVVFLLFFIGLELSLARLLALRRLVFGLGSLQVLLTGAVVAAVSLVLGLSATTAVVVGGVLALSSTAIVLQHLSETGELAARHGRVTFSILLLQDLAIVPLLILVSVLGNEAGDVVLDSLLALGKAAGAILLAFALGRLVLHPLYRLVAGARNHEVLTGLALTTVLGGAYLLSLAGLSMALGAFLAGLVLSGSEFRHQVEADLRPIKGLLLGLFFIYVGLSLDFDVILAALPLVLGLAAALLIGKAVIATLCCRLFGQSWEISLRCGGGLSQAGEFGFVLLAAAVVQNVMDLQLASLLAAVVGVTMALSPLGFWLGDKAAARSSRPPDHGKTVTGSHDEELHDHVIIAGYGRVGQTVARLLAEEGVPFVALDMDPGRVQTCRAQGLPVYYGDASRSEILQSMGIEQASALVVTLDGAGAARHTVEASMKRWPEVPILARVRDVAEADQLKAQGVQVVVPEAVEGSLRLGAALLTRLGRTEEAVDEKLAALRHDDYRLLAGLVAAGAKPAQKKGKAEKEKSPGP